MSCDSGGVWCCSVDYVMSCDSGGVWCCSVDKFDVYSGGLLPEVERVETAMLEVTFSSLSSLHLLPPFLPPSLPPSLLPPPSLPPSTSLPPSLPPSQFTTPMYSGDACQCDNFTCVSINNPDVVCSGRGKCCEGICECELHEPSGLPFYGSIRTNCDCFPESVACTADFRDVSLCNGYIPYTLKLSHGGFTFFAILLHS